MLTKEKCLFALESFKPANIYEFEAKGYLPFTEANSILTQLINEHFELVKYFVQLEKSYDNLYDKFHNLKPLNFENLHDFMPVFDVKTGFWIMITSVTNGDSFGGYVFNKKDATLCFNLFTFEENRFYQREVNNDE